ncbi:MAG TPA: GTP 3',8-cyclase MoaA [Thermoplasmataceae archaeon]|nr:GTP 3',8-cyclase MoaA [Thermoplasmataceae archaeon]
MENTLSQTQLPYGQEVVDNFGRPVRSMRIQLNTVCNFKCFFCHMEGTGIHSESMSAEEIERVIRLARRFGVNKIKFTGGEPTLRPDIIEIVRRTRSIISGNISMTTNGFMLPSLAKPLKEAGLDRVNISLHSIEPEKFQFITGTDSLDRVIQGIRAARAAGFSPIKINFVVLKDLNVEQIPSMLRLAAKEGFILQLIEFETTRELEHSPEFRKYHMPLEPIELELRKMAIGVDFNELHKRPRYLLETDYGRAQVEFVKPMRNYEFCNNCTRLRLTSTGKLKPCLMRSDNYTDILGNIRRGDPDSILEQRFIESVKKREPYWKKEDAIESQSQAVRVSEG